MCGVSKAGFAGAECAADLACLRAQRQLLLPVLRLLADLHHDQAAQEGPPPGATDRHGDRATPLGGGAGWLRGCAEDLPPPRQRLLRSALANSSAHCLAKRQARNLMLAPVSRTGRLISSLVAGLRWPLHALASLLIWPKLRRQLSGGQLHFRSVAVAPSLPISMPSSKRSASNFWWDMA